MSAYRPWELVRNRRSGKAAKARSDFANAENVGTSYARRPIAIRRRPAELKNGPAPPLVLRPIQVGMVVGVAEWSRVPSAPACRSCKAVWSSFHHCSVGSQTTRSQRQWPARRYFQMTEKTFRCCRVATGPLDRFDERRDRRDQAPIPMRLPLAY